jgi:predicted MPP superfamily phosphohydrolase
MLTLLLGLSYASVFVNERSVHGSASYVLNGIVMPRILYPTFILPEGAFEAKVIPVQGADVWKAVISGEFGNYELKVESATFNLTDNLVTLKLKAQQAKPGLYALDLTAFTTSGAVVAHYREPNSVSVRTSFNLPFRVMWITDTHIDDRPDLPNGTSAINFRRIVRLANFLRPDFILHTGDVVNMGNPLLFPLAYNLIQDLEVPMIACPGNHDHVVGGDYFTQYFASRNGSLNVGPVHFVTLDTGPGSIIGELLDSQLSWLDRDLTANDQSKFKILMLHHPMFNTDTRRNDTVQPVYGIALKHHVNLILNGHMHEDIVFHGPILTLVTSNSYEGGRPYTGFRMLTISDSGIEWHYAGGEPQIPLYDFDITYSQPNDGKSYGIVVELANRWKMSVSGALRLRVGYGQFLKVEGATYSSLTNTTGYMITTVPVTLAQGETRRIVAYTRLDNDPPIIESNNFTSTQGPSINVAEFRWKIYDSVLGIKNADMYYSTDNKTWTKTPLTEIEPRVFWARLQFVKSTNRVFYYVVALDVQGLSSTSRTSSGSLTQVSGTLSTTETQSPHEATAQGFDIAQNAWMFGLVAVLLVAVTIGSLYLRRRSK